MPRSDNWPFLIRQIEARERARDEAVFASWRAFGMPDADIRFCFSLRSRYCGMAMRFEILTVREQLRLKGIDARLVVIHSGGLN